MTLPKFSDITTTHTIDLSDDVLVTFTIRAVPGARYNEIIEEHKNEEGFASNEAVARDVLVAGVRDYTTPDATQTFTDADADEIWTTWPEWARFNLYEAVVAYSTTGKVADPFSRRKPTPPDGE